MPHEELIFQFCTTEDEREAAEILTILVSYYLLMYDQEKERFANDSNVEMQTDSHDKVRDDYALYIADLFLGMRNRVLEKMAEEDETITLLLLYKFVNDNFARINESEIVNLKQIAQLQVVSYVQQTTPSAKIFKRWIAGPGACEICQALNGVTLPIDEPFLVNGQIVELSDGKEFIYNYIDRLVAIAHPNDRCFIEFIIQY